jgi:hypothetical protein
MLWFLFVFDWQERRMADGLPCICIVIVAGMEYELTTSLCLASRFRMCGALPPYMLYDFMV